MTVYSIIFFFVVAKEEYQLQYILSVSSKRIATNYYENVWRCVTNENTTAIYHK